MAGGDGGRLDLDCAEGAGGPERRGVTQAHSAKREAGRGQAFLPAGTHCDHQISAVRAEGTGTL